jgi:uncharacterized cupin superfamily protein
VPDFLAAYGRRSGLVWVQGGPSVPTGLNDCLCIKDGRTQKPELNPLPGFAFQNRFRRWPQRCCGVFLNNLSCYLKRVNGLPDDCGFSTALPADFPLPAQEGPIRQGAASVGRVTKAGTEMRKSDDESDCVIHWAAIEGKDDAHYPGSAELHSIGAPLARHLGLTRIGIHHERLLAGRRTSFPHAESAEEEFVFVLEGTPDVWLDGYLQRLGPGMSVGFPAGTGLAHSFLNNTDSEVRLLVVGETSKPENRILYPLNPDQKPYRDDWWEDAPKRKCGPHDGLTDTFRAEHGDT